MTPRLLMIEDDPEIVDFLSRGLVGEGYAVECATDGQSGLARALEGGHDLILLDVMLPQMDGIELCRALRAAQVDTFVLMLTAKDGIDDRIQGLRSGADDYLPKPFAFGELLARVEALLRRSAPGAAPARDIVVGELVLDAQQKKLVRNGEDVSLTVTEYALLEYLMVNAGRVCSRRELIENVWGYNFDPETNIVEVYISYLRSKLGKMDAPETIRTIRGFGYMLSI